MIYFKDTDIKIYTEIDKGRQWLEKYSGCLPIFTCTLGFTNTALLKGISTAGKTSESRRYTALAIEKTAGIRINTYRESNTTDSDTFK